jgi:two-component system LytT family response regulator
MPVQQVLIIEDEKPAVEKLTGLLQEIDPDIRIAGVAMSIQEAVSWLKVHAMPDLLLMDISLTDGSSFDIFNHITITCPVIFITAYDEYWQEAFERNSIDYLLKPVKKEKLAAALQRYDKLKEHFQSRFRQLMHATPEAGSYKKRFLVKRGSDLYSIPVDDIACFFAAEKLVCLVDAKGQRFVLDQSLSDLEKQLNPADFNRVNRKFILHRKAILRAKSYSKSKLLLDIVPPVQEDIIISQEYLSRFKEWFGS